jgi:hypothetical protein
MPQLLSFLHSLRPRGFGFAFQPYQAFGGRQFVAVAAGSAITAFGLPE